LAALKPKLLIIDTALKSSLFGFAGGCFYMTIKGRHFLLRWCSGWSTRPQKVPTPQRLARATLKTQRLHTAHEKCLPQIGGKVPLPT
jgi:hypothetical protein